MSALRYATLGNLVILPERRDELDREIQALADAARERSLGADERSQYAKAWSVALNTALLLVVGVVVARAAAVVIGSPG